MVSSLKFEVGSSRFEVIGIVSDFEKVNYFRFEFYSNQFHIQSLVQLKGRITQSALLPYGVRGGTGSLWHQHDKTKIISLYSKHSTNIFSYLASWSET